MYKAPRKASKRSALSFVFNSPLRWDDLEYAVIPKSSHTKAWVRLLTKDERSN